MILTLNVNHHTYQYACVLETKKYRVLPKSFQMHLEKYYIDCMPFCYSSTCVRIPKYPSNVTASCLEQEERGSVTITRLMHQLIGTS